MVKTYSITEILFSIKAYDYGTCLTEIMNPEDRVGQSNHDPETWSDARGRFGSNNKPSKLSTIFMAAEAILTGKVNALSSLNDDSIYVELDKNIIFFIDQNQVCSNIKLDDRIWQSIVLLISALGQRDEAFVETKSIFEDIVEAWNRDDYDKIRTLMFKLCDAYYYEQLELGLNNYIFDNNLETKLAFQRVRTGEYDEIPSLANVKSLPNLSVSSNIAKETPSINTSAIFEECKGGMYAINTHWDIERNKYIPDIDFLDDFVPNDTFYTMVSLIDHEISEVIKRMDEGKMYSDAIKDNYINCQFIGRPGTGKTILANALASTFGMPVRVVTNSKNTEEDTYQGMTKVQEGGFKFVDTAFLDTFKNGGIILLEEYNLADPGVVMGAIGQAIEKPHILLQDGFEEVKRHPLCIIIATANTGTQGSREPSEAFTSRMPHVFLLDDPKDDEFIEILQKRSGMSKKDCKNVHKIYKRIVTHLTSASVNEEDVALSITLRHCLAALTQMKIGVNIKSAIKNTIIGTIGIKNLQLANEVMQDVVEPMKV